MELIERYIYAVVHRLPSDMQADVSDELRSSIDAALEEKGSRSKKSVEAVLTSLGDPAIIAARYTGQPKYIIGPDFYPIFLQALKLVLGISLPIMAAVGVIVQIAEGPSTIIQFILGVVGLVIGAGIQMVFWTAFVFFVLERCGVKKEELSHGGSWTPSMLPTATEKRQIPRSECIADLIWYTLVMLLPFIAQPLIGMHINGSVTPFFNPDLWNVGGVVIVFIGIVGVIKSLLKLKLGKWTKPLAIFNAVFATAVSVVLIATLFTQSLVNLAFLLALDAQIGTSNLDQVTEAVTWIVGLNIAIFVGIYFYDAINSLYRAFGPVVLKKETR